MQESIYCFNIQGQRIPAYDGPDNRPSDLKFIYCTDEKSAMRYVGYVKSGMYMHDVRAGFIAVPPAIAEVVLYMIGQLPSVMSRRNNDEYKKIGN